MSEQNDSCGTCAICCVWSGVDELKKYAGQTCKHLNGANPNAKCSIYAKRPPSCAKYLCFWRQSDLPEEFRPDKSGMLVTVYPFGATICVHNADKAGDINDKNSLLSQMVNYLHTAKLCGLLPLPEVRIVYPKTKKGLYLKDGNMYICRLLGSDKGDYEGLKFAVESPPIGQYFVKEVL